MTDYKRLCAELLAALEEEASNWNLDPECHPLVVRARAALAEPEPEGPTDKELLELTEDWPCTTSERHDLSGCPEFPLFSVYEDEVVDFARDVLARWGNHPGSPDSSLQPVPVSERLPGSGDCDAEGECYWFDPEGSGAWYQDTYQGNYTHWLPTHILPLPS